MATASCCGQACCRDAKAVVGIEDRVGVGAEGKESGKRKKLREGSKGEG